MDPLCDPPCDPTSRLDESRLSFYDKAVTWQDDYIEGDPPALIAAQAVWSETSVIRESCRDEEVEGDGHRFVLSNIHAACTQLASVFTTRVGYACVCCVCVVYVLTV